MRWFRCKLRQKQNHKSAYNQMPIEYRAPKIGESREGRTKEEDIQEGGYDS